MLRELIDFWKADRCENLCRAVDEFTEMINDVNFVFNEAWGVLITNGTVDQAKAKAIRERDVAINKHERHIRRLLVEHLSINPRQDVPGCLALMSIVKDAERMGDYAKNILDLAENIAGSPTTLSNMDVLGAIQKTISENLAKLHEAYAQSNGALASDIIAAYGPTKDKCKALLVSLLEGGGDARQAVATALLTKYLARIGSHLGNIASGIIYPLDRIDFVKSDAES